MPKRKRVYRTIFGIPNWMITGASIFLLLNIIYDLWMGDRNAMRYISLGAVLLILLISIITHTVSMRTIIKLAKGHMGG